MSTADHPRPGLAFRTDGDAARATIEQWSAADPTPYALVHAVAHAPHAWSGVLFRNGESLAVLARTPGWPAVLASPTAPDADEAATVAAMVRDFGGINAPAPWAEAVSATIGLPTHGRMGILLHRLAGPPTLPRPAAGQAVAGLAIPLDLLRSWFDAFDAEVEPDMPHASITDAELRPHVPNTCIWFHQGRPVAMAVAQRPFHGGWAISRVYTPPEHRRRGYAGAVVHALCQAQLAAGARYLSLYTDLANPTSNRLYAAIGFVPVCDQIRLLWKIP